MRPLEEIEAFTLMVAQIMNAHYLEILLRLGQTCRCDASIFPFSLLWRSKKIHLKSISLFRHFERLNKLNLMS